MSAQSNLESIHPSSWNRARLDQTLKVMGGRKIMVVGDLGVDRYTIGSVERISPEAPVPIVLVQEERLKLGLAANVADNVKTLGGIPLLIGIIGQDRGAEDFRKLLEESEISSAHLIVDLKRRTVIKERIVSERQQLLRVDYEDAASPNSELESRILRAVEEALPQVDAVILEDYAKGTLSEGAFKSVIRSVRSAGKTVAVDPNAKTPLGNYKGASLLTPNAREAEALSGISIEDGNSLRQAGFAILKATSAEHVVITRGKEGMAIFTAGSPIVRLIPTYAREVYDVSGAGDTVIATLALALATGAEIEEAVVLGNLAAGVEVGKRGTATVTPEEIRKAMAYFT